jgi:hypothetical protein
MGLYQTERANMCAHCTPFHSNASAMPILAEFEVPAATGGRDSGSYWYYDAT